MMDVYCAIVNRILLGPIVNLTAIVVNIRQSKKVSSMIRLDFKQILLASSLAFL